MLGELKRVGRHCVHIWAAICVWLIARSMIVQNHFAFTDCIQALDSSAVVPLEVDCELGKENEKVDCEGTAKVKGVEGKRLVCAFMGVILRDCGLGGAVDFSLVTTSTTEKLWGSSNSKRKR